MQTQPIEELVEDIKKTDGPSTVPLSVAAILITGGTCLIFYGLGMKKGRAAAWAASAFIEITPKLAEELKETGKIIPFETKFGILEPLKQMGVPWEEAWEQCQVRKDGRGETGFNTFLHNIMRAAYENDDVTVKWGLVKHLQLSPEDSLSENGVIAKRRRRPRRSMAA